MRRICILLTICVLISSIIPGFILVVPSSSAGDSTPESNRVSADHIWSITQGTEAGHNAFYSIAACQEGGYIATGVIWYQGRQSLLLVRIDESGRVIWRRIFQEFQSQVGRKVIECQSGGFAIIGYITDNNHDALLVRTDESGSISWFRTYGGVTNFDQGLSLVECQSGGFAFAGFVISSNFTNSDYWLVRTDTQGNFLWDQFFGGTDDDICYSLVESEDESFVLAGSTESFGGGNEDAWILRTTSTGDVVWNTTYGGLRPDVCYNVIQTSSGDYVFVGETENTPNLVSDGFAASILDNGTIQWSTTFGRASQNIGYAITECIDGGYGVTGRTIDWERNDYFANLWLVRLGGRGEYLWSKSYGGTGEDEGRSILQSMNGNFIIAGISESFVEEGAGAWGLRVPDGPPPPVDNRIYGPPNFFLIAIGTGLSLLVVLGSFLLFHRSQKELSIPLSKPSRRTIRKSYLSPRVIEDLSSILTGLTRCDKCCEVSLKADVHCSKCTAHLHRCLFCDGVIQGDDPVIFCPSCGTLAHHTHMLEWITKQQFCPRCGLHLPNTSPNSSHPG